MKSFIFLFITGFALLGCNKKDVEPEVVFPPGLLKMEVGETKQQGVKGSTFVIKYVDLQKQGDAVIYPNGTSEFSYINKITLQVNDELYVIYAFGDVKNGILRPRTWDTVDETQTRKFENLEFALSYIGNSGSITSPSSPNDALGSEIGLIFR